MDPTRNRAARPAATWRTAPFAALLALGLSLGMATASRAVTLYDGSLATLPTSQGWTPLVQGAAPAQTIQSAAWQLDTTGAGVGIAGVGRLAPFALDTATGFDLVFQLAVDSESHTSNNRAGYSVVVVGNDPTKAIELAFWSGNVWAYDYVASDPDRFVHGPDAVWNTSALQPYRLVVRNDSFALIAGGTTLLSGALRDYTPGGLPYTQPNFLFFGDDTTRGNSVTRLSLVSLTPVPEPSAALLLAAGIAALAWRRRRA